MTVTTPAPYGEFKDDMLRALEKYADEPVRFRGMRMVDSELYFVVNLTAESKSWILRGRQRDAVWVAYSWALWWHDEDDLSSEVPTAIRILEINNTGATPNVTYLSTSKIQDWNNDDISKAQLGRFVVLGTRNQTTDERQKIKTIDRAWGNRTYHNESYRPWH